MELIDRFKYLMKLNNLSASAFAEKVGVQPSSVSHILSGRNKPSLEFIQKVLAHFPKVSADWLISGKTVTVASETPQVPQQKETIKEIPSHPLPTLNTEAKKLIKIVIFYSDNTYEEVLK
jgi:transcriptional regulator with XRE-family HTH domain